MTDYPLDEKQVIKIIEDALHDHPIMEDKEVMRLFGTLTLLDMYQLIIILERLEKEKKIEKRTYYCAIEKEKKS